MSRGEGGGRPRTSLDDLPKGWEETMLQLAKNGASDVRMRVKLGITKDQWYSLIEYEPTFSETTKRAKEHAENWWQAQGERGLFSTKDGEKINAKVYELQMMNRFGWNKKEAHDIDAKVKGNISVNIVTSGDKR